MGVDSRFNDGARGLLRARDVMYATGRAAASCKA